MSELNRLIEQQREHLSAEEYQVLALRYGLQDDRAYSPEAVAEQLHKSTERVQVIEIQALHKLGDFAE